MGQNGRYLLLLIRSHQTSSPLPSFCTARSCQGDRPVTSAMSTCSPIISAKSSKRAGIRPAAQITGEVILPLAPGIRFLAPYSRDDGVQRHRTWCYMKTNQRGQYRRLEREREREREKRWDISFWLIISLFGSRKPHINPQLPDLVTLRSLMVMETEPPLNG